MIKLQRLSQPRVLEKHAAAWTARYVAEVTAATQQGKAAPRASSKQYAHPEVREQLRAVSYRKCFYCETQLEEGAEEVDHYIEMAERPDLAFDWGNLCLSCRKCNDKVSNKDLPVARCVDPCDPGDDPALHLHFDDGIIQGRFGTKGDETIRKYKLDRPDLEIRRWRTLKRFSDTLGQIKQDCFQQKRLMTRQEADRLRRFADPSQPFSQMFRQIIGRMSLLR